MAFNPSHEVAIARDAARKLDADQVVIIAVSYEKGTLKAISYGETKALCAIAKDLSDHCYQTAFEFFETEGK